MARALRERRETLAAWSERLPDPGRRATDQRLLLDDFHGRLILATRAALARAQDDLRHQRALLERTDPRQDLVSRRSDLENLARRMALALGSELQARRAGLERDMALLHSLSPLNVLGRGYSITRLIPSLETVRDADRLQPGDRVRLSFRQGEADCRVEEVPRPRRARRRR
jgi:exodeoxyribonuclease VII large subunit